MRPPGRGTGVEPPARGAPARARAGRAVRPVTAATASPAAYSSYWVFYAEVAARQLAEWLPRTPGRVLDVSGGATFPTRLLEAGHRVVQGCLDLSPTAQARPGPQDPSAERLVRVRADCRALSWVRDSSVDAVLAELRGLSQCLAAEGTGWDLARVRRPGCRLLLVVGSLSAGLAHLAG